jgi:hypothetical protein
MYQCHILRLKYLYLNKITSLLKVPFGGFRELYPPTYPSQTQLRFYREV